MLLFFIRHGDPIYNPNQLTPLGKRQAEAVAKRLSVFGLDKIYVSPSNRAMETAQPTCEILKKTPTIVDWADEDHAWKNLCVFDENGNRRWAFAYPESYDVLTSNEVHDLGFEWYKHPYFADKPTFEKGIKYTDENVDEFLSSLGYVHDRKNRRYNPVNPTEERVCLFAHQGFGLAFLSSVLDIPYPDFCTRFDIGFTGMTVIEFKVKNGYVVPKVLTLSSDGHLYKEGLPLNYQNRIYL